MTHVDILDEATLEIVDECYGPADGLNCPRSGPGGVVACAGRRVDPDDSPEHCRLWIPPGTRHCPLAWNLEAFGM